MLTSTSVPSLQARKWPWNSCERKPLSWRVSFASTASLFTCHPVLSSSTCLASPSRLTNTTSSLKSMRWQAISLTSFLRRWGNENFCTSLESLLIDIFRLCAKKVLNEILDFRYLDYLYCHYKHVLRIENYVVPINFYHYHTMLYHYHKHLKEKSSHIKQCKSHYYDVVGCFGWLPRCC